ncbi:MAG: glycosyltransferase family 4 protein [Acidimicrobiia bacterium]|nr:glycosyltransferase family 4 protein [Acidimicrobiia bacterium]
MRVALVNNFFPPRASGSAHLTEELASRLAARGTEVLVVTAAFGDAPAEEERDGYRVVRLPSRTIPRTKLAFNFDVSLTASPRNLRRLFRLLDEFAPDVIHQHGQFFDLTFMSSWYARRRRIPTVLSVHTRLEHPTRPFGVLLWLGDVTLVRAFVALSRPHVVVMDRPMHDYIRRRYAITEERLVPIPVGVEPTRFAEADGHAVRERLGLGERPILLSLGHVIPVRDRLALVESLPHLVEKRPDVAVVVVGTVYDDRFRRRAEELGVADRLVLTGGIPKDEVPEYLAAADVEAHDLQGYGLGTASLEVMAAGVPVVSVVDPANFPGVELRSWENLVIVPPDDPRALAEAFVRLLDDRALAARIGAGQQRLIERHFTLDVVTDLHAELYERLAADRSTG